MRTIEIISQQYSSQCVRRRINKHDRRSLPICWQFLDILCWLITAIVLLQSTVYCRSNVLQHQNIVCFSATSHILASADLLPGYQAFQKCTVVWQGNRVRWRVFCLRIYIWCCSGMVPSLVTRHRFPAQRIDALIANFVALRLCTCIGNDRCCRM
jgi:hypothetical protein